MDTPRFYAACLASYNNGILHGRWIDASTDADEMQADIAAMLRESPCPNVTVKCDLCNGTGQAVYHNSENGDTRRDTCPSCLGNGSVPSAEEWAIHDSEYIGDIGEYAGLKEIADRMELAKFADDQDVPLAVVLQFRDEYCTKTDDPQDVQSAFEDHYFGQFGRGDEGEWAAQLADDIGYEVPDWLQCHVDWQGVARDFLVDYGRIEHDGTVYLFR